MSVPPEEMPTYPWWYCQPKEEIVCPVRANDFVPFAEYDADFKFPVASSRVASKIPRSADGECQPCSPNLLTPPSTCGWVGLGLTGLSTFLEAGDSVQLSGSNIISTAATAEDSSNWVLIIGPGPDTAPNIHFRITLVGPYTVNSGSGITEPARFSWDFAGNLVEQANEASNPEMDFAPSPMLGEMTNGTPLNFNGATGSEWMVSEQYSFLIEVYMCDDTPGTPP